MAQARRVPRRPRRHAARPHRGAVPRDRPTGGAVPRGQCRHRPSSGPTRRGSTRRSPASARVPQGHAQGQSHAGAHRPGSRSDPACSSQAWGRKADRQRDDYRTSPVIAERAGIERDRGDTASEPPAHIAHAERRIFTAPCRTEQSGASGPVDGGSAEAQIDLIRDRRSSGAQAQIERAHRSGRGRPEPDLIVEVSSSSAAIRSTVRGADSVRRTGSRYPTSRPHEVRYIPRPVRRRSRAFRTGVRHVWRGRLGRAYRRLQGRDVRGDPDADPADRATSTSAAHSGNH
jgi:hypothetical protein